MCPRLHITAEGQTEERYANRVLVSHLGNCQVVADVRCVKTGRRRGRDYRGGLLDYLGEVAVGVSSPWGGHLRGIAGNHRMRPSRNSDKEEAMKKLGFFSLDCSGSDQ